MFDIARAILRELDLGEPVGVVVVMAVHGSAPRAVGAAMAVTSDGRAIGSISGGCVEAEAYELGLQTLETGESQAVSLGGPDDLLAAGLSCGGTLRVLSLRVTPDDAEVVEALRAATGHGTVELSLEVPGEEPFVLRREALGRMIIVGAVDFTAALAKAARALRYRVIVVDPRPVFATPERLPKAHEVVVDWPERFLSELGDGNHPLGPRDAVCVLTHQQRLDVPALSVALRSDAGYVGAMGSRGTHEARLDALREAGVTEADLAKLHSPIGLDLGGSTPEETAIAILAEIIATRTGASGAPLGELAGPIHER